MKIKYVKEIPNIRGRHRMIECKPCCDESAKWMKSYISDELIETIVDECPFCKEKIELMEVKNENEKREKRTGI